MSSRYQRLDNVFDNHDYDDDDDDEYREMNETQPTPPESKTIRELATEKQEETTTPQPREYTMPTLLPKIRWTKRGNKAEYIISKLKRKGKIFTEKDLQKLNLIGGLYLRQIISVFKHIYLGPDSSELWNLDTPFKYFQEKKWSVTKHFLGILNGSRLSFYFKVDNNTREVQKIYCAYDELANKDRSMIEEVKRRINVPLVETVAAQILDTETMAGGSKMNKIPNDISESEDEEEVDEEAESNSTPMDSSEDEEEMQDDDDSVSSSSSEESSIISSEDESMETSSDEDSEEDSEEDSDEDSVEEEDSSESEEDMSSDDEE